MPTQLHNRALRLLSRRSHSEQELRRKLSAMGFNGKEVNDECQRLLNVGLLDDLAFSEAYLHSRATKGFGPSRIANELTSKGVAKETIATVLAECDIDWVERRRAVEEKKCLNQHPTQAQLARFLHYRGFTATMSYSDADG